MTHINRGRMTVVIGGHWRIYTRTIPQGARMIGVVHRDISDYGALVQFEHSGLYAQVNAGIVRQLDQRKVSAAILLANRPNDDIQVRRGFERAWQSYEFLCRLRHNGTKARCPTQNQES